jgi:cytochrome-b5 reductase
VPARRPGFGLSDWTRLVASSKDLALRRGAPLRQIRWREIWRHNTVVDGWLVLRGKVYFVSPYLAYHPGGEKILRPVLGKDASSLFDKYHQWVNVEKYGASLACGASC